MTNNKLVDVLSVSSEAIGKKTYYYLRAHGSLIGRYENLAACFASLAHFVVMESFLQTPFTRK